MLAKTDWSSVEVLSAPGSWTSLVRIIGAAVQMQILGHLDLLNQNCEKRREELIWNLL